jgi:hypothetical protein
VKSEIRKRRKEEKKNRKKRKEEQKNRKKIKRIKSSKMQNKTDPRPKNGSRRAEHKAGNLLIAASIIFLFLSLIIILRLAQAKPVFPQGESYYNLRIAQSLKASAFITKDPLEGTEYYPNPYHYLITALLLIFNSEGALLFLPLILGVASALLFFKLLSLIGVKLGEASYSLLILSATPAYLILFTGLHLEGFILFLSLLVIILLTSQRAFLQILGIICSLILALTSLAGLTLTILVLLVFYLALKKNLKLLILSTIVSIILVVLVSLSLRQLPRVLGFHAFNFKDTLSLLGARVGFDVFLLLIFMIGFIVSWIRADNKRLLHLSVLAIFALSFFNTITRALTSFIIAYYCAVAINYLYKRKWELGIIRTGTLLLVLCSLAFSAANQMNILVSAQPDSSLTEALIFFRGLEQGRALTDEPNGFLVEFYAGKEAWLDDRSFLFADYQERQRVANTLFESVRIKDAEPFLNQSGIKYILITPRMKEELWENNDKGLWFLMKNSESFVKRYEKNDIALWEYRPKPLEPEPGLA